MIWKGELTKPIGYAEAGRHYIRALGVVGYRNLRLRPPIPIQWGLPPFTDPYWAPLQFYRTADDSLVDPRVQLVHGDPTGSARESVRGLYNICLTVWETSRLSGDSRLALNGWFKEVWVPSEFNARIFKESGVTRSIRVVPHCIDLSQGDIAGFERPADIKDCYVFYFIGSRNSRKNPQAALKAYLEEFTADDPVVFIWKSWAPARWDATGNRMVAEPASFEVEQLAKARNLHSAAPRVISIDRELSRKDVLRLHAYGDCFVSPHRGEGFGLAVLEARVLGRPVIATAWSGPNEFLDFGDDARDSGTDIGIPFEMVPVKDIGAFRPGFDSGQRWADPSIEALRAAMRTVFNERRRNVGPGKAVEYTSEKIGRRMAGYIDEAHDVASRTVAWKPTVKRRPQVTWLTTFNERCGVAIYTEHLARALTRRGCKLNILSRLDAKSRLPSFEVGVRYTPTWKRGCGPGAWMPDGPGILHVQHEFSFWPQEHGLVAILKEARKRGLVTVVTVHTLLPPGLAHAAHFKALCQEADYLTALGVAGATALRGWCEIAGVSPDKVSITKNVCVEPEAYPREKPLFRAVTPGFVSQHKRVGDVLYGVQYALEHGLDGDNFAYLITGAVREDSEDRCVEAVLQGIADLGLREFVVCNPTFADQAAYEKVLANASCLILFNSPVVICNSSVALDAMRFGKPSISSRSPANEYLTEDMSLKVESIEEIGEALVRLQGDPELCKRLGDRAFYISESFDPEIVAATLEDLYERVVA